MGLSDALLCCGWQLIVEGSHALHPSLHPLLDLKIAVVSHLRRP